MHNKTQHCCHIPHLHKTQLEPGECKCANTQGKLHMTHAAQMTDDECDGMLITYYANT